MWKNKLETAFFQENIEEDKFEIYKGITPCFYLVSF